MSYAKRTCVDCGLRKSQPHMKKVTRTRRTGSSIGGYNIGGSKTKYSARVHFSRREQWVCKDCRYTEQEIIENERLAKLKHEEKLRQKELEKAEREQKRIEKQELKRARKHEKQELERAKKQERKELQNAEKAFEKKASEYLEANPNLMKKYEKNLFRDEKINKEIGYKPVTMRSYFLEVLFPLTFFFCIHKKTWDWGVILYPIALSASFIESYWQGFFPEYKYYFFWLFLVSLDILRSKHIVEQTNEKQKDIFKSRYIYRSEHDF